MIAPASWNHPRVRQGIMLIGLGAMVVIVAAAFTDWSCFLAVYNCPASGCGNVPASTCAVAVGVFQLGILVGLVLGATGLLWLFPRRVGTPYAYP